MVLLTFEGIDGSGKSTQARLLDEYLQEQGHKTLLVREPGGTTFSERVRDILLDSSLNVQPFAELLLFSAARAQLVTEQIRPALEAGRIVICDRFYDSTTAYQGAGRGVTDPDWLAAFHERVTGHLVPDRTFLVEVDPETARARRTAEEDDPDRMEAAGSDFYERVGAGYERLAEQHPDRIQRLDGTRTIDALHRTIRAEVEAMLDASDS
jgi:dTMP kinase